MSFADGKYAYLVYKLNPSGTITLDRDIGVSSGRLYLVNDNQAEWINFTSSTLTSGYYILGGVTRNVDPVLVPMTGGTDNKTWLANQKCTLVQPHDTMFDATSGGTIGGAITVPSITVTGATVLGTSFKEPVYANATARDAVITSPSNGMSVYLTAEGYFTDYQSGVWSPRSAGAVTPNATTTIAGKVQLPTTVQLQSGTATGGTGATLSLSPAQLLGYYPKGDGSDGAVVISTNTSLTRDMFYTDLTVNTGITLDPAGYAIFVNGTLTLTGTAKIARNGNAGGNASGVTGGNGATALSTGTCGPCLGGVIGGAGSSGASVGSNGTNGVAVSTSYATTATASVGGGAGGTGGLAGGTGGTSATATQGALYNTKYTLGQILAQLMLPARGFLNTSAYGGMPSSGSGGGGGANSTSTGGGGGGSGGNGGIIIIYANAIAGSGTIEAKGGVGGNGGNATGASQPAGGGGAGSGGCGGIVVLIYNSGTPYSITLTGGASGSVGAGVNGGASGSAGSTGTTGQSILINV